MWTFYYTNRLNSSAFQGCFSWTIELPQVWENKVDKSQRYQWTLRFVIKHRGYTNECNVNIK